MLTSRNNYGYEMDKNGNVIKITNLYASTKYFENIFRKENIDNEQITGFKVVEKIQGDYITDYTNADPLAVTDVKKFTICYVIEVRFMSTFGTLDSKYYYVIYRSKWYNRWANVSYPSLKKYQNKDGVTIKTDILIDSEMRKAQDMSTLVLCIGGECKLYYIKMRDILNLEDKIGIFTDKWNQQCVGIPKDMFSFEDPNNNNSK